MSRPVPEIVGVVDLSTCSKPLAMVSIPKAHVKTMDFAYIKEGIKIARKLKDRGRGSLFVSFAHYGNVSDEIYEIKEIRDYVAAMYKEFPYLFYLLSELDGCMQTLLLCLCDVITAKPVCAANLTSQELDRMGLAPWERPKYQARWEAPDGLVENLIHEAARYAVLVDDQDIDGFKKHFRILFA